MLPLLLIVFSLVSERCLSQRPFEPVCKSDRGTLLMAPAETFLVPVKEFDASSATIFVRQTSTFHFKCLTEDENVLVKVDFKRKPRVGEIDSSLYQIHEAEAALPSSQMKFVNAINRDNTSVFCHSPTGTICSINLMVLDQEEADCNFAYSSGISSTLSCNITSLVDQISSGRVGLGLMGGRTSVFRKDQTLFSAPIVKYSFFEGTTGRWVACKEVDSHGRAVAVHKHAPNSTKIIQCPVDVEVGNTPVIVRIEQTRMSALTVGLPSFSKGGQTTYTYFSVLMNSTLLVEKEGGTDSSSLIIGLAATLASMLTLIFIFAAVFYRRVKNKLLRRASNKDNKTSCFYADINLTDRNSAYKENYDLRPASSSGGTDTTFLGYSRMDELLGLFRPDELQQIQSWDQMDKDKRRTLLQRQLSGDPSKINPELSLNQQVNNLSYDSKMEVDRHTFEVGKLLGSGHFGSVYLGEASGLLHAGSKTIVAVKTVNDSLEVTQLATLLCEMKILANLDLHVNLVNLLGSCTAQMDEGRLWLLLEYCPHGDLKSFLFRNRDQFRNSISGTVSTELDCRLFLKWSHSVACGMRYLASRKIMHGDLAARNVLLGEPDHVAKVGDFGLSKSLYRDDARYRKRQRNYVPWKWMAPEFLVDGCFTLRSDVWSFGVTVWEMLSLGREPYAGLEHEEAARRIAAGLRLQLPEESGSLEWAEDMFEKVVIPSWETDPNNRIGFDEVVSQLETLMEADELYQYKRLEKESEDLRRLMFEDVRLSKRNTINKRKESNSTESPAPPGSYHKVTCAQDNGYVAVAEAAAPSGYVPIQAVTGAGGGVSSTENGSFVAVTDTAKPMDNSSNYITISMANSIGVV